MRRWQREGPLAVMACALVLAGCSAANRQQASLRHDAGLHLSPDPANATSQVTAVLEDAWVNPATCRYTWLRNGTEITGAASPELAPAAFHKGDVIGVVVDLPDSGTTAHRRLRAEVHIENSPPVVMRVGMSLTTASGKAEVQSTVECVDPDGDRTEYAYRWFKNDAVIAGATEANLPAAAFDRGDQVAVEVIASDGTARSAPLRSEPLAADNHPPQFTSQPSAPGAADDTFRYQAVATDPDGDRLTYELVSGPDGMTVGADGSVSWPLPARDQRHGSRQVVLRARDAAGGQATQEFAIPLEPRPAPGART